MDTRSRTRDHRHEIRHEITDTRSHHLLGHLAELHSPAMRRPLYIVVFLGVLACGLLLYLRVRKQEAGKSLEAPMAGALAALSPAPPRLAPAILGPDANPPRPVVAIRGRDAGNDGRLSSDEQSLMQQLRDALTNNPRLAETLAREGQQRFPDSPNADERDMLLVGALFNQGRMDSARTEAYFYFVRHPGGRFTKDLSALTGAVPELVRAGR